MKKIIFLTSLFIFFTFIGIEKMSAVTVPVNTNTGIIYITGEVDEDVYNPGDQIWATVYINIGSSLPTSVGVSGSANGGSNSFFGGTYTSGYSGTEQKLIGIAQSTPGTYNANFSYSYSQTPPDAYATLSLGSGMPSNIRFCYLTIFISRPLSQNVQIGGWLSTSVQDLIDARGSTFTASGNVSAGLTYHNVELGPCHHGGNVYLAPVNTSISLNDGSTLYISGGETMSLGHGGLEDPGPGQIW